MQINETEANVTIVCCSLSSAEYCTSHSTHLFSPILYAAADSSAQCVLRLRSRINISFSEASPLATSEGRNCVRKENVNFLLTPTQSRSIIRGKIRSEACLGWSHLHQPGQKKKKKTTETQVSLDPIASSLFPLLPAPRWLALHLRLYHTGLEGLSSLGSAFQVCCFLSPHSPLGTSAQGSSGWPPELPTSAPPAQSQSGSRADPCLCLHTRVGFWVRSSAGALGRAISCPSFFSGG